MSTPSRRRLMKDFRMLTKDTPPGVMSTPSDNNIMLWSAVIFGPPDTPYEGGVFRLSLEFSEEYPAKPPKVRFLSDMYHPNVYKDGNICLDTLQKNWTSAFTVGGVLTSIQSLLDEPNPDSPANSEAAHLFENDRVAYERRVLSCVEASWVDGAVRQ